MAYPTRTIDEQMKEWRRVVFACEFGEDGNFPCPVCGYYDGQCECPGPTMETEDGRPFLYMEIDGVLYAKEP